MQACRQSAYVVPAARAGPLAVRRAKTLDFLTTDASSVVLAGPAGVGKTLGKALHGNAEQTLAQENDQVSN